MNPLIFALALAALSAGGFFLGTRAAQRSDMTKQDRRELDSSRDFIQELSSKAAEHSLLGDDFAVIVTGMLLDHRAALRKRNKA